MTAPQGPTTLDTSGITPGDDITAASMTTPFGDAETATDEARTTALCKSTDTVAQHVTDMLVAGNGIVLTDLTALGATTVEIAQIMAKRATMWHDESTADGGNALTHVVEPSQSYRTYSEQSPAALNDAFTNSCTLLRGTYTFAFLALTGPDCGLVQFSCYVNGGAGQSMGSYNLYTAAPAYDVEFRRTGLVIAGGYVVVRGMFINKDPSSSDYRIPITKMWFEPEDGD